MGDSWQPANAQRLRGCSDAGASERLRASPIQPLFRRVIRFRIASEQRTQTKPKISAEGMPADQAPSLSGGSPMSTIMTRHMTVDEFERLEESLGDERVELINGCVIGRGDMEPAHVLATGLVKQGVEPMLPGGWFMRKDEPVRIPDFNEPFPDLAVVHGDLRTYAIRHPGPGDVALLIEVSDTTLAKDRDEKMRDYARARIPVYWIVNLIDQQIEVYSEPTAEGDAAARIYSLGDEVPVLIDGGGRTPRGVGDHWLNIAAKVCYSGSVGLIDPRTTSQPSRGRR